MSHAPPPGLFGPMPEVGTTLWCVFCTQLVTLQRNPASGWHYWTAPGDRVDGSFQCDGGSPGNAHGGTVRTLHKPSNSDDGTLWAWRYTPDGAGRMP